MPALSMFYGIVIFMYFFDNKRHQAPHFHAEYAEFEGVFSIETGEMIEGNLPNKQKKLVLAWAEIHKEELMANWQLAVTGQSIFRIDPLR